jgi:hypothetical protein
MKQGDIVLIWGATGGLGGFAAQLVRNGGGIPICVVSSQEKVELLNSLGIDTVIDRKAEGYRFWDGDQQDPAEWKRFGKRIRELTGGLDVDIVFEHPGRQTFGASVFVTRKGGKVITCASTSGYMHEYDNRYLWMNLKSIISSHFANYREAWEANRLVDLGMIHPILTRDLRARGRGRGRPRSCTTTPTPASSACWSTPPRRVSGRAGRREAGALRRDLEAWKAAVGVAALVPLTIGLRGVSTQPRWTPLPLTVSFGAGVVIVAGLVQVASLDLAGWLQVSEEAVRSLVVSYQLLTSSMSYVAYIGAFVAAVGLVVELRAAGDAVPRPVPYVALAGAALVGLLVLDVLAGTDIGGQWAYVLALGVVTPLTAGWTAWALGRARVSASQTG